MNIRPIGSQILLRFLPDPAPKPGEIFVGHNTNNGPKRAEVLTLGGAIKDPEVKVGDVVLVDRFTGGTELKEDGVSYCLVRPEGLLAIVETTHE